MPRIIKEGEIAEKPPVGLRAECNNCNTVLETTEDEPTAYVEHDLQMDRFQNQTIHLQGWYIRCPKCMDKVWFENPTFRPDHSKPLVGRNTRMKAAR